MKKTKRSRTSGTSPEQTPAATGSGTDDGTHKPVEVLEPEIVPATSTDSDTDEPDEEPIEAAEDGELPVPYEEAPAEDQAKHETPEPGNQLVPYDPLEAYLREIRAYPPLSREDEHELALKYHRFQDLDAAYRLVTSNLWLVVKIARDYEKAARNLLDLVQEGNIGLMEAVKNFDPFRGVRFPSYAVWWIKAYMVRFIIANWRLVKIGTTQAQRKLFFNLKKEKERLEREGFYPGPKLLAEKLNVKESEVVEMEQRLGSADVSFDTPVQPDSDATLMSVIPSSDSTAEDLLGQRQMKELLREGIEEFAGTLKKNEVVIFRERMLGEEKATLQEIAEKLSLSRERVRQIENRLREKLKVFLEQRLGPAIEHIEL